MKNLTIPAKMFLNDKFIEGSFSPKDALFKPFKPVFVLGNLKVKFNYKDNDYEFDINNLGGKYFISNHKNNISFNTFKRYFLLEQNLETKNNIVKKVKI